MRLFLFFPLAVSAQISFSAMHPDPSPTFPLYSPATYKAVWDFHLSPYAGGEDLLFAHRALERAEIYFISKSPIVYSKTAYARVWRLSELIAIWLPLNYFTMVVQHEVFGHGYRIRDINRGRVAVTDYSFGVPPPYGHGGGSTGYNVGNNLTTTEDAAISSGGVEATAILALSTKLKWLQAKSVDPRQALLYLFGQYDLSLYIDTLKVKDADLSGHDIHGYLKALNYTYPDHILSKGRLRSLSWINLADPFTYYALYSWFRYLSTGKETRLNPCYLANLRLGLTPFGPEILFEHYIVRHFYAYLKGGRHANNNYFGIGVYAPQICNWKNWFFGLRIDLWRQPKLLLQPAAISLAEIDFDQKPTTENPLYPSSERHKLRCGGAGSILAHYKGAGLCGFEGEIGYKAEGFLPGYSLRAFPTLRLGFTLLF